MKELSRKRINNPRPSYSLQCSHRLRCPRLQSPPNRINPSALALHFRHNLRTKHLIFQSASWPPLLPLSLRPMVEPRNLPKEADIVMRRIHQGEPNLCETHYKRLHIDIAMLDIYSAFEVR